MFAIPLAALQLVPTWELKQRSQRLDLSAEFYPGYGHLPPQYWTQAVAPWLWYPYDDDALLTRLPNYAGGAGTNQVEAHLYFGMAPLALALVGWLGTWRRRDETDRVLRLWGWIGIAFLLYTPGWFLPITQHVPGFNFFRGPGRYGIVTSLAVAVIAGATLSRFLAANSPARRGGAVPFAITLVIFVSTAIELHWVARNVGYSQLLPVPVVERRFQSPVRRSLLQEPQPARLFAPMANVANLLDAGSFPVYLGIGPAQYFDPRFTFPSDERGGLDPRGDPAQLAWLEDHGVTHLLALERMNSTAWPVELIFAGADPLLTTVFGRSPHEPFFLYRLKTATGRVVWKEPPPNDATLVVADYGAQHVKIACSSSAAGTVILRDLDYPGWFVSVDGRAQAVESAGMFRAVSVPPGEHEIVWAYRPASVYWGGMITALALSGLLSASVLRFIKTRRPRPTF